jgi:hypothetical protein
MERSILTLDPEGRLIDENRTRYSKARGRGVPQRVCPGCTVCPGCSVCAFVFVPLMEPGPTSPQP